MAPDEQTDPLNNPTTLTVKTIAQLPLQPGQHLTFLNINRMDAGFFYQESIVVINSCYKNNSYFLPGVRLGIFYATSFILKAFQEVRYHYLNFPVGKIQMQNG